MNSCGLREVGTYLHLIDKCTCKSLVFHFDFEIRENSLTPTKQTEDAGTRTSRPEAG